MDTRLNRRVVFSGLFRTEFEGRVAYRGEMTRYRNGKYIYYIPWGIKWVSSK